MVYSLNARIVGSQQLAVTRQWPVNDNRNGILCAVRADGRDRNSGISNVIAQQQLHCNRGAVFSPLPIPKCHKQDKLGVR